MEPFDEIIADLNTFNNNIDKYIEDELERNEDAIIDINTLRIYNQGTDSEGKKLKNRIFNIYPYTDNYKREKQKKGVYTGVVNLFMTGDYLGAYKLEVGGGKAKVDIDPSQADLDDELQEKYSKNSIKGLTDKEWVEVTNTFIAPMIYKKLSIIF